MPPHKIDSDAEPALAGARRGALVWERIVATLVGQLGTATISRVSLEDQDLVDQSLDFRAELRHSTGLLGRVAMTGPIAQVVAQSALCPNGRSPKAEPRPLLPAEAAAAQALLGLSVAHAAAPLWLRPIGNDETLGREGWVRVAYELTIGAVSGWLFVSLDGKAWLSVDIGRLGLPHALLDRIDLSRDWLSETYAVQVGLARVCLDRPVLEGLSVGDLLLPVDWHEGWKVGLGRICVERRPIASAALTWDEQFTCTWIEGIDGSATEAADVIDVLFAELELTMATLIELHGGRPLELDYTDPLSVVLSIDGSNRGRGELVSLEGRVGIRIVEWR